MERSAVGAGDFLFPDQGGEIAPGRGLGDAETAAKLLHREVAVLFEQLGQPLTASQNHMHGDFHADTVPLL